MVCERCDLIDEYGQPYPHFPPHSQTCEIIVAERRKMDSEYENAKLENANKLKLLNKIKNKLPDELFKQVTISLGFNKNIAASIKRTIKQRIYKNKKVRRKTKRQRRKTKRQTRK